MKKFSKIKGLVLSERSESKGFTLIELLIVITIIGILMALAIASYAKARASARDAKRQSDLEQIRSALEIYRADHGFYPPNGGWCTVLWGCGSPSSPSYPQVRDALVTGGYIASIPKDPRYADTNQDYFYRWLTPNGYELYAQQEVGGANGLPTNQGCVCGVSGAE